MKKILLTLCLLIIIKISFGQTNTFPPSGNIGIGTISPTYKLDILGSSRVQDGFLNSDNYFEKVLPDIAFANGVANLAVDLKLGNVPLWGYIEVEITSTYNYQNSVGKLTKIYAVGINPGGAIYTNESRVSDIVGTIGDNISFGELSWDNANSTYKIPVSHIVSTGNNYTIKVKMFTNASVAKGVFDVMNTGPVYNLTALPKNYVNFNSNVGIGTSSPENSENWNRVLDVYGSSHSKILATTANVQSGIWSHSTGFYSSPAGGILGTKTNHPLSFITNGSNKLLITNNGNVGIGTTTPTEKLTINGDILAYQRINFLDNARFTVTNADIPNLTSPSFSMVQYGIAAPGTTGAADLWVSGYNGIRMFTNGNTKPVMNLLGGNVGIGTTDTKGYKLAVAGEMIAERVVVKLTGTWPDYVFNKKYDLRPLEQVEQFINQNSHLLEVPSAQEITDKGIDVGAMNAKLLQKVEELTLYLIEQNKEIKSQSKELISLKKKFEQIKGKR